MGPKRPEKKRARKEETYYIARKGVKWRPDRTRCVVEMRPPKWHYKLHFGSFGSKAEAMVARDYGAFLRVFAGENEPDAGGFDSSKLYYFEESPGIFESMAARTKERCASIRLLYPQMGADQDWTNGEPPHLQFCKLAREDIGVAIRLFRERYSHRLTTDDAPPVTSPWANLLKLPPAQIAVAMDGSPRRILVDIQAPLLEDQHVLRILRKFIQGVEAELNQAALEKLLHDLPPCTYDPVSIPAIDDSESKM